MSGHDALVQPGAIGLVASEDDIPALVCLKCRYVDRAPVRRLWSTRFLTGYPKTQEAGDWTSAFSMAAVVARDGPQSSVVFGVVPEQLSKAYGA